MAATKFDKIYRYLKESIENGTYKKGDLIPSENALTELYGCSRNTVRRAVMELGFEGYVQSLRGKGVRVVWEPDNAQYVTLGHIESFTEFSRRTNRDIRTEVPLFIELVINRSMARLTSFSPNTEVYYIQRVRYLDGEAFVIDHNYFHKEIVNDLTHEIAGGSIYDYIENELHKSIAAKRRTITVELATPLDRKYLSLGDHNCVAVLNSYTFNKEGEMFEFTQSRHSPQYFTFNEHAQRARENA